MNLTALQFILAFGLVCHLTALAVWVTLYRSLEKWIWWTIFAGFVVLAIHRVDEVLHFHFFPYSSHITAAIIAVIIVVAVFQTRTWARKRERLQKNLVAFHSQLEELTLKEPREPIAHQVAEILTNLRNEIDYYEGEATKNGTPLYKDSRSDI